MSSSWGREPHGMRPWPLLAHSLPVFRKVERAAWCEMGVGKEAIFGGVLVPTTLYAITLEVVMDEKLCKL